MNGDQQIEAPANARPLSDADHVAGRAALGAPRRGLGGGGATASHGPTAGPATRRRRAPEAEDFKDYADCLDKARPEDTEALQRCAELLQRP